MLIANYFKDFLSYGLKYVLIYGDNNKSWVVLILYTVFPKGLWPIYPQVLSPVNSAR